MKEKEHCGKKDIEREHRTCHENFSIIYRHGKILHDRAMREFQLTGQQMGHLKCIFSNPGISQEELAKKGRIDKGAVAKAVKDMLKKGYVTREKNPDDGRAYCLYPTEKARNICREGERHGEKVERIFTEGMTKEEIETFETLLTKITDNIAKMLEGGKTE